VYVRTITRNEFYDFLKARGVRSEEEVSEVKEPESIDRETVLVVRSAFSHLPEEQRRAIQAVYLEGRTYEEAAAATGIPLRANALKLLSQQHFKQVVGIESAGKALAGQALGAGLLP